MKKLLNLSAVVIILSFPRIASAVPMESGYPVAQKNANPVCYMEQQKGLTLDLTRLCASSNYPIRSGNTFTSNSYSSFNSSTSSGSSGRSISSRISGSSGNCNSPDDIAADGSRCGGRAASQRSENTSTSSPGIGQRTIPQGRIVEFTQRSS